LSGNPLAMAAGITVLELLSEGRVTRVPKKKPEAKSGRRGTPPSEMNVYNRLEELGGQLEAGMKAAAKSAGVPMTFNRCGSMFCAYFTGQPVWSLADAMKSDRARFAQFFHGMLAEGTYLAPSQFEAGFISAAHSKTDIEKTVGAAAKVLRGL
jgi:glutamate-1-semialdehyde 2,1-aminomutase